MDSGNSSSMQSSSGGGGEDDEFDSTTAVDPIRPPLLSFFNPMSTARPWPTDLLPYPPNQTHPPSLFHRSPNFNLHPSLDDSTSTVMLNRDLLWPPVEVSAGPVNSVPGSNIGGLGQFSSLSSSMVAPAVQGNEAETAPAVAGGAESNTPSRSKKRTRASRRAPTTVLAVDTTNFRSMVQQYTGIPSSPFSSPYSRRFDLISSTVSRSSLRAAGGVNPFRSSAAQKLKTSSSSSSSSSTTTTTTSALIPLSPFTNLTEKLPASSGNNNNDNINIFPSFDSDHLPSRATSRVNFSRHPLNFNTNPQLTFQSLLSSQFSPLKYPSMGTANAAEATVLGDAEAEFRDQSIGATNSSQGVEEMGHDQQVVNARIAGIQTIRLPRDRAASKNNGHESREPGSGRVENGGNFVNCSASSPNLYRDQAVANAANSRGEVTLTSWIYDRSS